MTGWVRISRQPGFVYCALVDGEIVRVDFGDAEPDGGALTAVVKVVQEAQRTLAGAHVRQIAIGSASAFAVAGKLAGTDEAREQLERSTT